MLYLGRIHGEGALQFFCKKFLINDFKAVLLIGLQLLYLLSQQVFLDISLLNE
jgi:hypothetical protein